MITKILLGFVLIIAIVSDAVAAPPNVILIIDDQHNRRYMSWTGLGEGIKTPSLDKLASESVAFTNAYASVPQCGPARYSMYSGRYASEHGVLQNDRPRLPHFATLQATLARSGYTTASIGKLHPAPYNARLGFQYVLNHEFYQDVAGISHFWPYLSNQVKKQGIVADRFPLWNLETPSETWLMTADGLGFRYDLPYKLTSERWVTQQSILFLEDQLKNRSTTPFFLHASYFAPHHPYGPVAEFDTYLSKDMFLAPSWTQEKANNFQSTIRAPYGLPPFTADQYRDLKAYYFGFIAQVDNEVGRLLNWLDTHPAIAENTIVIFLSDHGDMMSEHGLLFKGNMYEGSVGIPFMIRWPGIAPRKESAPVSHIDIMPTILAAAGIPFPDGLSGDDLKPLLATSSPGSEWTNRTVISEYFPPSPFPWGLLMARSERYKLIATRTSTITMDYQYQLYDLVADPWEMSNLAAKPEFSDVLSFLKTELEAHKAKQSKFLPASMPAEVPRCTWDIKFPYDPLVAPWEPVKVLHCP